MSKSDGAAKPAKIVKGAGNVSSIADKKAEMAGKEPNDAYDKLSRPQQDKYDEIGKLGYRPDLVKSGWIASEMNGDGRVGPFESLNILYEEVKEEVRTKGGSASPAAEASEDEVELVDETNEGQKILPTMEVASVKHLDDLIRRRAIAVKEFTAASAKVQEVNKECLDAFEGKLKEYFVLYPEKKKHIYKSQAGGELRIKHSVTDTVESVLGEDEDED